MGLIDSLSCESHQLIFFLQFSLIPEMGTQFEILTELGAPVTEVVNPVYLMTELLKHVTHHMALYGRPQVTRMEWLGYIRRTAIWQEIWVFLQD